MTPYSPETYRVLIRDALKEGYRFVAFTDETTFGSEQVIYLRHDVDFSLAMAVELGRINEELGVSGTFFVLLRGHAYNPASDRSLERMEQLLALDQRLAFHWAVPSHASLTVTWLVEHVRRDYELARQIVPSLDPVFAIHSPSPPLLERCRELEAAPLINVNGSRYWGSMPYYGDSNLRYSVETWRAIVRRGEPQIQVLLHPVNWIAGGHDMLEVLRNAWPYLLSEAEAELRLNQVWSAAFADGLPESACREFGNALRDRAAES